MSLRREYRVYCDICTDSPREPAGATAAEAKRIAKMCGYFELTMPQQLRPAHKQWYCDACLRKATMRTFAILKKLEGKGG